MLDIISRLDHLLEFLSITISYRRSGRYGTEGINVIHVSVAPCLALSGHN